MKKCKQVEKKLSAYLHGELKASDFRKIEAHLAGCEACRAELAAEKAVIELLGTALEAAPAPVKLSPWRSVRVRDTAPKNTFEKIWFSPQFKAALASGVLTTLFLLISGSYVIFTVVQKQDMAFEPPAPVMRPRMELKQVKVGIGKEKKRTPKFAAMPETMLLEVDAPEPAVAGLPFNTEQYDAIIENSFCLAMQSPLSTFSIDVDTAAYSNVRRFLNHNQLPPPDAVRIEEMVNYFQYDYPQPDGIHPLVVSLDVDKCPWNEAHQLALIGLQGLEIETENLPPNNLTFLVDASGSMDAPYKMPLLKSSLRLLVEQMRPEDRISIVAYAGAAGLVLAPTSDKTVILNAIENLEAGGSTAGGAGIELAYKTAKESFIKEGNNRVILATDGDFNVGVSSDGDLVRLIQKKRNSGIYLTVLGFGMDNYKDSKMEKLAQHGSGNYAYIDDILEAKKVLVNEMGGTLKTIAKDVKLQIEFNPAHVKAYRLIGYENRMLATEDFDNDQRDAGELGAGHTVTALYELIPADSDEKMPELADLKYQKTKLIPSDELMTVKLRYKTPDADDSQLIVQTVKTGISGVIDHGNLEFAGAVAEFGLLLRDSEFKANASYDRVLERARENRGEDPHGYRAEFIRLVEKAKLLSGSGK